MNPHPQTDAPIDPAKIGIAIAVHNAEETIGDCLDAMKGSPFHVVVFDDGSVDKTVDIAHAHWPGLIVIRGDGTAWWAGGTQSALDRCFADGCEFAMMLNPDARISASAIIRLVERAIATGAITSALVLAHGNENCIAWPGARVNRYSRLLPIYIAKAVCPIGSPVNTVGTQPYRTDEVHGRGVVLSRRHFDILHGLDYRAFPHYGADNDLSKRACSAGIEMEIVPNAQATLLEDRSGMHLLQEPSLSRRFARTWKYLTNRRHGEAARVIPLLYFRHLPIGAALCSTAAHLAVGIAQRMNRTYGALVPEKKFRS